MLPMPIYGKRTLKNLLPKNQESFGTGSWYNGLGTQGLPSLFKQLSLDDPKSFLWQGQIFVPVHLYWENVEKSFSQIYQRLMVKTYKV